MTWLRQYQRLSWPYSYLAKLFFVSLVARRSQWHCWLSAPNLLKWRCTLRVNRLFSFLLDSRRQRFGGLLRRERHYSLPCSAVRCFWSWHTHFWNINIAPVVSCTKLYSPTSVVLLRVVDIILTQRPHYSYVEFHWLKRVFIPINHQQLFFMHNIFTVANLRN